MLPGGYCVWGQVTIPCAHPRGVRSSDTREETRSWMDSGLTRWLVRWRPGKHGVARCAAWPPLPVRCLRPGFRRGARLDSTAIISAVAAPPERCIPASMDSSAAPPTPACREAPESARTRVTATGRVLAREAFARAPAIGAIPVQNAAPVGVATTGNVPETDRDQRRSSGRRLLAGSDHALIWIGGGSTLPPPSFWALG
jgi:hypothetical protein